MNESILVLDNAPEVRTLLGADLRSEGYLVDTAEDGLVGLEKATDRPFDLIILDQALPYRSGLNVLRSLRQLGMATPVLILGTSDQPVDKVVALKLGADDYVTKPFDRAELMARVEALLRRLPSHSGLGVHQFGSIVVNVPREEVTRYGKRIDLTGREFQLLRYLIERAGSTVPRTELLRSLWGYDSSAFSRTVDIHVATLRQKIEEDPKSPELIHTTHGVGYRFMGISQKCSTVALGSAAVPAENPGVHPKWSQGQLQNVGQR